MLLLSGFSVVLAALILLPSFYVRFAFSVAGLGVEFLGVTLLTRSYMTVQKETR